MNSIREVKCGVITEEELNALTEVVIGCAFRVLNTLGIGFMEKVNENALAYELRKRDIRVDQQHEVADYYVGVVEGKCIPDLVVEQRLIVEIKASNDHHDVFTAQCLNQLKATGMPLCLLLNFGKPRLDIKRLRSPDHPDPRKPQC
jgi:GxxExxY protein